MLVLSLNPFECLLSRVYLSNLYWAGAIKSKPVSVSNLNSCRPSYFLSRKLNPNANQVQNNENN